MVSASLTVWWLLRPWISTTAPMPQASCSNLGSYRPAGAVRSFQRSIPIPSYLYHRCAKNKKRPWQAQRPARHAIVPLRFIIPCMQFFSSDRRNKSNTHPGRRFWSFSPEMLVLHPAGPVVCQHAGRRVVHVAAGPGAVGHPEGGDGAGLVVVVLFKQLAVEQA